jgi:LPLT family lysophospholipid transporter-like MFS transporter
MLAGQLHRVGDLRSTQRYGWALAGMIVLLGIIGQQTSHALLVLVLILAGVCGGLFLIPLNAGIQAETDPTKLGKTIATQNFINNSAMLSGGGFIFLGTALGSTASVNFLLLAGIVALLVCLLKIPNQQCANVKPGL